ncbi:MAG: DUF411 domain-containing protein, partial [Paraglaciecola polaris]
KFSVSISFSLTFRHLILLDLTDLFGADMYQINKYFNKKMWVFFIAISVSVHTLGSVFEKEVKIQLEVYKAPSCGCCKKWISHIEKQDIIVNAQDLYDIGDIKSKFNINPNLRSCHTTVSMEGYVFEGHVPAKFITRFLVDKHHDALGLSVPGMPLSSPGMELNERFMPYEILLLLKDGSSQVYTTIKHYEEQF